MTEDDEAKMGARLAKLSRDEVRKMIGTLHERTFMSDEEYIAAFPHSPYVFSSVDEWLIWLDSLRRQIELCRRCAPWARPPVQIWTGTSCVCNYRHLHFGLFSRRRAVEFTLNLIVHQQPPR